MRFFSLLAATALIAACSSSDGAVCADYEAPASFNATTPVVSLRTDLFPIIQTSCAFVTCHGQEQGASNGVFLSSLVSDASKVRAGLVDQPSEELPAMLKVKAGAPHDSYLMRKIDGSNCVLASQCVATANTSPGDCGVSMPRNNPMLTQDQRDAFRRWILQGAADN